MPKAVFLIKRKPGLSPEEFRNHYENVHIPLAMKYIGHLLLDYRRNYPQALVVDPAGAALQGEATRAYCDYDCITEMWVEKEQDLAEMAAIFGSPEVAPILAEDEARFLDSKNAVMIMSEEVFTDLSQYRA